MHNLYEQTEEANMRLETTRIASQIRWNSGRWIIDWLRRWFCKINEQIMEVICKRMFGSFLSSTASYRKQSGALGALRRAS